MSLFVRSIALIAAALCGSAGTAPAQVESCVDSVAEFDNAYRLSAVQPVTIKMVAGSWFMTGSTLDRQRDNFFFPSRSVRIEGGYNSGCTSRSSNPGATVLNGSVIEFSGTSAGASTLHIERLTFRAVSRVRFAFSDGEVFLNRVWLDAVAHGDVNSQRFTLRNSVVAYGGSSGGFLGSCAVEFFNHNPERVEVEHTTFTRNLGPAALCINDHAGEQVRLSNNVFWENGLDLKVDNRQEFTGLFAGLLFNNVLGTGIATETPPLVPPVATQTGNPLFVGMDNFRLSGTSPAINSGRTDINLAVDQDFDGNPRWFGAAPDRGAFESSVGSTTNVLTVTNTNNSGSGSLRQALNEANAAPNLNEIRFNIPGTCPRTITLGELLPTITQPVVINGYTQPGSARNTAVLGWNANLCIVLNGANQITGAYGFNVDTGASPDATVSIEGIAFSGHSFAAAQFVAGRNHRFVGNQIGGAVGASNLIASGTGVRIGGTVEGVRVGGPEPADRNVIADALGIGVNISGSGSTQPTNAVVENNYIGTQSGGDSRGNQRGVFIAAPDHVIRNNVIAESVSHGIELSGSLSDRNRITGNRIGVPALCFGTCPDRSNGGHGVLLRNGADDNRVDDNLIAWNSFDGIAVTGARRNSLRRNTFYEHGGVAIDLGDDGRNLINANNSQPAPADAGNDDQNAPSITAFAGTPAQAWASGSLTSSNGWYRIDFHGIPSATGCTAVVVGGIPLGNWGEGRDWLGSTWVQISNGTATADGNASWTDVAIHREGSSNYFVAGTTWITATATRLSGTPLLGARHLGTSEFGRCRQYVAGSGPDPLFSDGFEAGG